MKKEFQSEYILDLKTYQEFCNGYKAANKIEFIILLILILFFIESVIENDYSFIIFYCAFLLIFKIILKLMNKPKIQYNRMLSCNNGNPVHNVVNINEENILITGDNGNKSTYSYDQIIGVIETKNLLILKMKYNLGININKNTLTGGNIEDLASYLYEKCPNIKKKKIIKTNITKHFDFLFTILLAILLILSIAFDVFEKQYISDLKMTLELNDYNVISMSSKYGSQELKMLQITKDTEHGKYYIYTFDNKEDSEINFNYWFDLENDDNELNDNCTKQDNNYQKCIFQSDEYYTILIRNERYVLYGRVFLEYKNEMNTLLEKIDYLK